MGSLIGWTINWLIVRSFGELGIFFGANLSEKIYCKSKFHLFSELLGWKNDQIQDQICSKDYRGESDVNIFCHWGVWIMVPETYCYVIIYLQMSIISSLYTSYIIKIMIINLWFLLIILILGAPDCSHWSTEGCPGCINFAQKIKS